MLGSLWLDWVNSHFLEQQPIILNGICITGLFSAISLFTAAYLTRNENKTHRFSNFNLNTNSYKRFTAIVGLIVLYFSGFLEVAHQAEYNFENTSAHKAMSLLYHLMFTAILCVLLYRKKELSSLRTLNIISIFNILVYVILFIIVPFAELKEAIAKGVDYKTAYYLHYCSLALVIFFGWLLYKTNKGKVVLPLFKSKATIAIAVVLLVIIASSELLLQGLYLDDISVTETQISTISPSMREYSKNYGYNLLAQQNIEEATLRIVKTGLPILWGLLSFTLLILGIRKKVRVLRIAALILLGITIIKLFAYDISNVSETGKIIAFILLGVLILIISFVYQKLKVLITDEEETNINTQEKKSTNE